MFPGLWHGLYQSSFEDVRISMGLLTCIEWWHGFFNVEPFKKYYLFEYVNVPYILSLQPVSDSCSVEKIS